MSFATVPAFPSVAGTDSAVHRQAADTYCKAKQAICRDREDTAVRNAAHRAGIRIALALARGTPLQPAQVEAALRAAYRQGKSDALAAGNKKSRQTLGPAGRY